MNRLRAPADRYVLLDQRHVETRAREVMRECEAARSSAEDKDVGLYRFGHGKDW
jgi:hypothetical protein